MSSGRGQDMHCLVATSPIAEASHSHGLTKSWGGPVTLAEKSDGGAQPKPIPMGFHAFHEPGFPPR